MRISQAGSRAPRRHAWPNLGSPGQGGLRACPRDLAHQARDQIAGESLAQNLEQIQRVPIGDLEMGRALHGIKLMKIIGQNATGAETLAQRHESLRLVVDPMQQDTLAQEWQASMGEPSEGRGSLLAELAA